MDLPDVLPFTSSDLCELMRLDRQPTLMALVQQLMPHEGGFCGCRAGVGAGGDEGGGGAIRTPGEGGGDDVSSQADSQH